MDKLKHTPGPWKIEYNDPEEEYWVTRPHYDAGPAKIIYNIEDARLIAAAPDLLAALQRILPFVDCIAAITREDINEYEQAYKDAIAAIAKAEGLNKATGETK